MKLKRDCKVPMTENIIKYKRKLYGCSWSFHFQNLTSAQGTSRQTLQRCVDVSTWQWSPLLSCGRVHRPPLLRTTASRTRVVPRGSRRLMNQIQSQKWMKMEVGGLWGQCLAAVFLLLFCFWDSLSTFSFGQNQNFLSRVLWNDVKCWICNNVCYLPSIIPEFLPLQPVPKAYTSTKKYLFENFKPNVLLS